MGATARRQRAAARFMVSPPALVQPRVQWWGGPRPGPGGQSRDI